MSLIANGALRAYAAAQTLAAAAGKAWTAAQWLLNAALTANPVGLVVAAIGLLVAGLVLAWQRSDTFRTKLVALGNGIRTAVRPVLAGLASAFDTVAGAVRGAWQWVHSLIGKIAALLDKVRNIGGGLLGHIVGAVTGSRAATFTAAPTGPGAARTAATALDQNDRQDVKQN